MGRAHEKSSQDALFLVQKSLTFLYRTMEIGNTIIRKINRHQNQSHNSTTCCTYLNLTGRIFSHRHRKIYSLVLYKTSLIKQQRLSPFSAVRVLPHSASRNFGACFSVFRQASNLSTHFLNDTMHSKYRNNSMLLPIGIIVFLAQLIFYPRQLFLQLPDFRFIPGS